MIHNYYGEKQGNFFKKLKIELPHDPEIPLLDIYQEKTKIQKMHAPQYSVQSLQFSRSVVSDSGTP